MPLAPVLLFIPLFQSEQIASHCDPVTSAKFAEQARMAVSSRAFDRAADNFKSAFEACPEKRGFLAEHANALLMARRFAGARDAAGAILRADPGDVAALKVKANAEYLLGEVEQAISTFIDLLEKHPNDDDGAYMLGRIYYQEARHEQAIGQFQRVLKLNPAAYKAWDNLALCWQALGDTEKATAHFLQAIKLVEKDHPEYDWAYANLADLLLQTGDTERAFAAAAKATNRNPNSARNFYIGAKALEKLGKDELCLNWLQRAAALDPEYAEPQYLLARVYRRLGEDQKAEEARKRFLEIKAKQPDKRR
jgi:tetratricopeptide (TPR) repeat protein